MPKRQITPHKGGRTARLNIRLTPEQKSGIEQAAKLQNKSVADYILKKVLEDKMPSNWFQITYYKHDQKRGRPNVKLVHKQDSEINDEFVKWCKTMIPDGSILRTVSLFLPSKLK